MKRDSEYQGVSTCVCKSVQRGRAWPSLLHVTKHSLSNYHVAGLSSAQVIKGMIPDGWRGGALGPSKGTAGKTEVSQGGMAVG